MIKPALKEQVRRQATKVAGGELRSAKVSTLRLEEITTTVASNLNINRDVVEGLLKKDFACFSDDKNDSRPVNTKTSGHKSVQSLMLDLVARHSTKRWDPIGKLPKELSARLSAGDRSMIQSAVDELQKAVQKKGLDHVPVFGYLSLRTDNHRELGKKSQADVVVGKEVVAANLKGWDLDMVASTVYRGTAEHPGAVAGLHHCIADLFVYGEFKRVWTQTLNGLQRFDRFIFKWGFHPQIVAFRCRFHKGALFFFGLSAPIKKRVHKT